MQDGQKILMTGIQPTGNLHLGNLLGAVYNAKKMTDFFAKKYFMIADLHCLTANWDPSKIRDHSYQVLANYLAAGLDIENSIFFFQSQNPDHLTMAWLLATQASFGKLRHMIQFKEKSSKTDDTNLALFSYPVLMAADILLYNATDVPVGDDQDQHLELTRDLANKLNEKFGNSLLTIPKSYHASRVSRVKSLQNPTEKMSKSSSDDLGRINITDSKDKIHHKIMKAVTDEIGEINYDENQQPGLSNLINIYSQLSDISIDEIVNRYKGRGYASLKKDLSEIVIEFIVAHQDKLLNILTDRNHLDQILKSGLIQARLQSSNKVNSLYQAFGI